MINESLGASLRPDLLRGICNLGFVPAEPIQLRHDDRCDPSAPQRRLAKVSAPNLHDAVVLRADLRDDRFSPAIHYRSAHLRQSPAEAAHAHAGSCTADYCRGQYRHTTTCHEQRPRASSAELISAAPRRELGTLRTADSDECQPVAQLRETDVLRGRTAARVGVKFLGFLDGFPALFERRKIPALTGPAHHSEPAARGIERDPLPDGEHLDRLVLAERFVTENAGGEHGEGG